MKIVHKKWFGPSVIALLLVLALAVGVIIYIDSQSIIGGHWLWGNKEIGSYTSADGNITAFFTKKDTPEGYVTLVPEKYVLSLEMDIKLEIQHANNPRREIGNVTDTTILVHVYDWHNPQIKIKTIDVLKILKEKLPDYQAFGGPVYTVNNNGIPNLEVLTLPNFNGVPYAERPLDQLRGNMSYFESVSPTAITYLLIDIETEEATASDARYGSRAFAVAHGNPSQNYGKLEELDTRPATEVKKEYLTMGTASGDGYAVVHLFCLDEPRAQNRWNKENLPLLELFPELAAQPASAYEDIFVYFNNEVSQEEILQLMTERMA